MKKIRHIALPKGYDPKTQRLVGTFASQFDDQLRLLVKDTKDLTVKQLEWQLRPGMNTIGMLLAHLAVVEVWWIVMAVKSMEWDEQADKLMLKIIGIKGDDDGLPIPPDGGHGPKLIGKDFAAYFKMLKKARLAVHKELRDWPDRSLDNTFVRRGTSISRLWVLYHVLEHFAGHYGQILLLKHMMQDVGVLAKPQKI